MSEPNKIRKWVVEKFDGISPGLNTYSFDLLMVPVCNIFWHFDQPNVPLLSGQVDIFVTDFFLFCWSSLTHICFSRRTISQLLPDSSMFLGITV